jgi:hypothetical protein
MKTFPKGCLTASFKKRVTNDLQEWLNKHYDDLRVEAEYEIDGGTKVLAVHIPCEWNAWSGNEPARMLGTSVRGWLRRNYPELKVKVDTTDYVQAHRWEQADRAYEQYFISLGR